MTMSRYATFLLTGFALLVSLSGCSLAPVAAPPALVLESRDSSVTGIAGTVTDHNGLPASGAYVYAYRSPRGGLRGPADFEAVVGNDGGYLLDLIEGSYHLVARRRPDGGDAGPPRAGDAWALPAKNPVTVTPGRLVPVDFVLQTVSQPRLMREGTLTGGDTGLTGILVDDQGHPVSGAFALAYADSDYRRMPAATSPAVGEDGRFTLYVDRPGRWCLAARTRTRGQPIPGELYGVLDEGAKGCRQVSPGQLIDVGPIRLFPYHR
jgi:hypothetical protein